MVGIPSARSPPPGLAIIFRLTGCGWYVLSCRSFLQAVQPARLDVLEALSVYPRRAFIGFGQSVSVQQNVLSVHLVVKLVETEFRLVLRSEEHTSELQSLRHLVCRLLLEKK